jgi:hypothetical protein
VRQWGLSFPILLRILCRVIRTHFRRQANVQRVEATREAKGKAPLALEG